MAILTASQLQTRGSNLARGVLGIFLFWLVGRAVFDHLRSPVQCVAPQPVAHSSIDASGAASQEAAKEDDERTLRCEAGYVIEGFQPLSSALMVCKDSGGESGEWQCSAGAAGSEEGSEEDSWPCAARACVEVSHCDALSDTFDTGNGQMVMDTRNCRQVELGKSCTVSCSEGFTGDSTFTCQRDGTWRGTPPACRFVDPSRAQLYEKAER